MWNSVFLSSPGPFIYFSKVNWPRSVSDSCKFICAWALRVQGADTGEVSVCAFLKSHLSEHVISSQNPVFNSSAEIQNPTHFHPTKPATSSLPGDSRHTDGAVCLDGQGSFIRRKGTDGNAKEIQIIFHNPECIQNKSISRKTELLEHMAIKKKKNKKKSCCKTWLFSQLPWYLHWFTFNI